MPDQPILRSDLTDQQIQDAGRRIDMGAREVDEISELFENDEFPEHRTDVAYRVLIPQRIAEDQVNDFVLHENIAPKNRSLKYGTFRKVIEKYGTRHEYTAEDIEDNPDSVVADCVEDLEGWATDMKKYLALRALKSTHSSVAPVEVSSKVKLVPTFDKAYAILSDVLEAEPWAGGEFLCIMPGVVRQNLKNELLALNGGNTAMIMQSNEQMKLIKSYVGSWGGFGVSVPKSASRVLQDATNYYIFFLGKTNKGKNPLRRLTKKGKLVDVLHHPLGSGIMKNADGETVPDYNHQKGGIGANLKGVFYYIRDDRFVLMCTIAKSKLDAIDISAEIPADGDDDGTVRQTLDRVLSEHGGTTSYSSGVALAISGATDGATLKKDATIQLAANHDVVWKTSTPSLCSVDQSGLVTGIATSGTAKVQAFDGSTEVEITFTCAAAA